MELGKYWPILSTVPSVELDIYLQVLSTFPSMELVIYWPVFSTFPSIKLDIYCSVLATVPSMELAIYWPVLAIVPSMELAINWSILSTCSRHGASYCGFGNFRVTFISRFFHFRIIREFLNSRASIRVVGHFLGLKIGVLCFSCER